MTIILQEDGDWVARATRPHREGSRYGIGNDSPISPDHTDKSHEKARQINKIGASRRLCVQRQTGAVIDGIAIAGISPHELMQAAKRTPRPKI